MVKSFYVPASNKLKHLKINARDYMQFSNNVKELNVVSSLNSYKIDASQLKSFSAGSNVVALMPSCFINCINMSAVSFNKKLESIGDYAFFNCSSLDAVSSLGNNLNQLAYIGDYAFAQCALKSAKLAINSSSSSLNYAGSHSFASCFSLDEFQFVNSNMLGDYMFESCSSLKKVIFAASTSQVGDASFKDCIALEKLDLPKSIFRIGDQFASGCTSLSKVEIEEPGQLNSNQALGNNIFENTQITSLTLPRSVSSFNSFSENTLAGMDNLQELHLNGMSKSDVIAFEQNSQQQQNSQQEPQQYPLNKIYCTSDGIDYLAKYSANRSILQNVSKINTSISKLMQYCIDNAIPITVFVSSFEGKCPNCSNFARALASSSVIDFIQKNSKCMIFYSNAWNMKLTINGESTTFAKAAGFGKGFTYVAFGQLWNNVQSGQLEAKHGGKITTAQDIISTINGFATSYSAKYVENAQSIEDTKVMVNPSIAGTQCFGLRHDIKIFTNDGQFVEFKADAGNTGLQYSNVVQVDKLTTNDFRYGQWYSKARLLKPYADSNYIPTLAIVTQGNYYKDSEVFNLTVFNSNYFQSYVSGRSMLLCKVDTPLINSGDASYLLNVWMANSGTKKVPLIMMYWHKSGGSINIDDENSTEINATYANFAYFSSNVSDDDINGCTCLHNVQEVVSWIDGLSIFKTYQLEKRFQRPNIDDFADRYPKYKYYSNQPDDDYGRYFPVAKLMPSNTTTYVVNVNNKNGAPTNYNVGTQSAQDADSLPPEGTYQYFSLLSDGYSPAVYDAIDEISGVIFKIGKEETHQLLRQTSFSYPLKTYSQYLSELAIAQNDIQSEQSSFIDDLYDVVETTGGTYSLKYDDSVVADVIENNGFLYNNKCIIKTNKDFHPTSGQNANELHLWLSSTATIQVEDSDDGSFAYPVPGNTQYVISSQIFGSSYGNTKVLWAREFDNNDVFYQGILQSQQSIEKIQEQQQQQQRDDSNEWFAKNDNAYNSTNSENFEGQFVKTMRKFTSIVDPGQWNGNLEQCSAVANSSDLPLIAIWSNFGCSHCEKLAKALLFCDNLKNYLKSSDIMLAYTTSLDIKSDAYKSFCKSGKGYNGKFPIIRLYWYKYNRSQKIVDLTISIEDINFNAIQIDSKTKKPKNTSQNQKIIQESGQKIIDFIQRKIFGSTATIF